MGRTESDTTERLHFHFHTLEKEMATHSSILAWKVPWTEEPGGLTVHGVAKSQTQLSDFTFTFIFRAHQAANMHLEERIPLKK